LSASKSICSAAILTVASFFLTEDIAAIERPSYEVIEEIGDIEIRKYESHIVAQTLVQGSFEKVGNAGFRRLAGYIFGDNQDGQKIAMTAPVSLRKDVRPAVDQYWVSFSMPSEYVLNDLAKPLDSRIELVIVASKHVAALRYKGNWSEKKFREHESALLANLNKAVDWEMHGSVLWARYNPPFIPGFMRTNEVAIEVVRRAKISD
jgi:hypothetical protein